MGLSSTIVRLSILHNYFLLAHTEDRINRDFLFMLQTQHPLRRTFAAPSIHRKKITIGHYGTFAYAWSQSYIFGDVAGQA